MNNLRPSAFLSLILICLTAMSCYLKEEKREMRWLTYDTVYDGLPLYLRRPDIQNLEQYKERFSNLFCITHKFDKVKTNGLPESEYNKSLEDFDGEICNLFDFETEGIVFLIETFGGERNYWFYIKTESDVKDRFGKLHKKYPDYQLDYSLEEDADWKFIIDYPFKISDKDE